MTQEQRRVLGQKLETTLVLLESELQALQAQLGPIAPECSLGDLLRAEMMQNQEVLYGTYSEAKKRYNRLQYAQSRLDRDDYGHCIDCDDAIAFERLLLMPESQYCVRCAKERGL